MSTPDSIAIGIDLMQSLTVLSMGRSPSFTVRYTTQGALDGLPAPSELGTLSQSAIVALASIKCRENVSFRTARIRVNTISIADQFRVAVNGTPHDSTPVGVGDTAASVALDIQGVLDGSGEPIDAVIDPNDDQSVVITGTDETNWTFAVSTLAGSPDVSISHLDATGCKVRLWAKAKGLTWDTVPGGEFDITVSGALYGAVERVTIAGTDAIYAQVYSMDGEAGSRVAVGLGPCLTE